jgi:hypothetical protein
VLPSICSPAALHAPLFAIVLTCCLKDIFLSKKIPSHHSVCCATIVLVLSNVSVIVIGGEGSCLCLEICISSDFSTLKLSPHCKTSKVIYILLEVTLYIILVTIR